MLRTLFISSHWRFLFVSLPDSLKCWGKKNPKKHWWHPCTAVSLFKDANIQKYWAVLLLLLFLGGWGWVWNNITCLKHLLSLLIWECKSLCLTLICGVTQGHFLSLFYCCDICIHWSTLSCGLCHVYHRRMMSWTTCSRCNVKVRSCTTEKCGIIRQCLQWHWWIERYL